MQIPVFESLIACGFPSPAQDYVERRLSLDAELIRYPESTYFLRAEGYSMKDAGIFDGDLSACWCLLWVILIGNNYHSLL